MLKRASSVGHHIVDNPSLQKRRRINRKAPARVEFIPPVPQIGLGIPSSSTSRPPSFLRVDAFPEGGSGIPLPIEEMEEIDLSSGIYAGMTLYDLKNGYFDRNKFRVWARSHVMKHHREEITVMITN